MLMLVNVEMRLNNLVAHWMGNWREEAVNTQMCSIKIMLNLNIQLKSNQWLPGLGLCKGKWKRQIKHLCCLKYTTGFLPEICKLTIKISERCNQFSMCTSHSNETNFFKFSSSFKWNKGPISSIWLFGFV